MDNCNHLKKYQTKRERSHRKFRKRGVPITLVCKIPLLAQRTRPAGQARRATIGYLVYNYNTGETIREAIGILTVNFNGVRTKKTKNANFL